MISRPSRGDAGSLVMAQLMIMVGVALTALLLSTTITQLRATHATMRRNHAGYAAQAGLEALVAQIRAADDGSGNGVRASLPCGPVSGQAGGGPAEQYQVTVYYLDFDPQGQMTAGSSWFAANGITCIPGSGPSTLPKYVVAYSVGTESGTSRTLRGAYRLRTTNQNIVGGRIHVMYTSASTVDLCMDTGTTVTPAAGTPLRMQTCDTTRQQQVFAYTQQSRLQLVDSVTSANPAGMCLDAGNPQAEGALVRFQTCASPVPATQQWQYQGNAQFEGMDSAGNTNGFVFQLTMADSPGTTVKITQTPVWDGTYNNLNGFSAEAAVGPGNAGPQNKQVVNYAQFGRCLDLTGGNYQIGFLIAWPCKPSWNQAYNLPALATTLASAVPAKITQTVGSGQPSPAGLYCLQSPRTTAAWNYPSMVPCSATDTSPALQWRAYGYTGNYATSYRILDVDGNCLQPADPPETFDVGAQEISKIAVRPCTGSTAQKWNADPDILGGLDLKYVGEN